MSTETTREEWLQAAALELEQLFADKARVTLPKVRLSVGFPAGARGSSSQKTIGECWAAGRCADGVAAIFVSPIVDDGVKVLEILTHELVHAVAGNECGHRGAFARIARAIGLEGPLTATTAGAALSVELTRIAAYLGSYREIHGRIDPNMRKKQGTRMLRAFCPDDACDFVARVTAKHAGSIAHRCADGAFHPCSVAAPESERE